VTSVLTRTLSDNSSYTIMICNSKQCFNSKSTSETSDNRVYKTDEVLTSLQQVFTFIR